DDDSIRALRVVSPEEQPAGPRNLDDTFRNDLHDPGVGGIDIVALESHLPPHSGSDRPIGELKPGAERRSKERQWHLTVKCDDFLECVSSLRNEEVAVIDRSHDRSRSRNRGRRWSLETEKDNGRYGYGSSSYESQEEAPAACHGCFDCSERQQPYPMRRNVSTGGKRLTPVDRRVMTVFDSDSKIRVTVAARRELRPQSATGRGP